MIIGGKYYWEVNTTLYTRRCAYVCFNYTTGLQILVVIQMEMLDANVLREYHWCSKFLHGVGDYLHGYSSSIFT